MMLLSCSTLRFQGFFRPSKCLSNASEFYPQHGNDFGKIFICKYLSGALVLWLKEETHIRRSWDWIPVPDTRRTFFTLICCKIWIDCLKRSKMNEKEAEDGPFLKIYVSYGKMCSIVHFLCPSPCPPPHPPFDWTFTIF